MPLASSFPCADLDGPYCPCALGLARECTYCTRLRGENRCACDWAGVCVLLAHPELAARLKAPDGDAGSRLPGPATRRWRLARILARSEPAPGVVDLRMAISPRLAPLLRRPGTFIFVRSPGFDDSYATPLTIVETGEASARLVFKSAGPKTQAAAGALPGGNLVWKGPYHSGLLGGAILRRAARKGPGTAVVVARGMGQIVALPVARALTAKGWSVVACVDPRGTGGDFAKTELERAIGQPAVPVHLDGRAGEAAVLAAMGLAGGQGIGGDEAGSRAGPRLLISCGTDLLHRWAAGIWRKGEGADGGWGFVATNNSLMACGEGTCGACTLRLEDGGRVRACKADVPPEFLFLAAPDNANGRARS